MNNKGITVRAEKDGTYDWTAYQGHLAVARILGWGTDGSDTETAIRAAMVGALAARGVVVDVGDLVIEWPHKDAVAA